jgi:hypothetical protein
MMPWRSSCRTINGVDKGKFSPHFEGFSPLMEKNKKRAEISGSPRGPALKMLL